MPRTFSTEWKETRLSNFCTIAFCGLLHGNCGMMEMSHVQLDNKTVDSPLNDVNMFAFMFVCSRRSNICLCRMVEERLDGNRVKEKGESSFIYFPPLTRKWKLPQDTFGHVNKWQRLFYFGCQSCNKINDNIYKVCLGSLNSFQLDSHA